ncbi:DUF1801 domain-containing protein [Sphingomonas sp. MMS12-HWE2-04]|uniref:DUF1801 domain-containing protein n=1 Tax=Sphingomonas sp. MMS12-HWE2-04 TaxID=3234199 RepID=UPI00384A609C
MESIATYLDTLDPEARAMIDALRAIVARSHAGLDERIKWNAPSFALAGDDRITLGIERKGGVRLVLHRGAKPVAADGFRFEDLDRLARWPSADRGVVLLKDRAAIAAKHEALVDLCRRWLDATG